MRRKISAVPPVQIQLAHVGKILQMQQGDAVRLGRQACPAGQKAYAYAAADKIAQSDGIVAFRHDAGGEVDLIAGVLTRDDPAAG